MGVDRRPSYPRSFGVRQGRDPRLVLFREGRAVVTGWSIASKIRERYTQGSVLLKDALVGNPKYLSPEATKDPWSFQPSGDQYSLGCILYEMLAGEPPFTGRSMQAVLARQLSARPARIRVMRPDVADGVEAAVLKALAKKPGDRYSSALMFAQALGAEVLGVRHA